MIKCKKVFCLLLTAMLLAMQINGVAYAGRSAEVTLSAGQEGLLRELGIITETQPQYDVPVSRAELANEISKIINVLSDSKGDRFYDVPKTHPYYRQINTLVELNMLHGSGDGYFYPDRAASEFDACKLLCCVLGYNKLGSEVSYSGTARSIGITGGLDFDGRLTKAELWKMIYNTLHCEMYEQVSYGDYATYDINSNMLAMERYFGLNYQTGIVEGAYGTGLTHPMSSIGKNELIVNRQRYYYEGSEELLGKSVFVYYNKDEEDYSTINAVYVYAPENKNEELIIDAEDIENVNGNKITYYNNNRTDTAELTKQYDVIYNGIAFPDYSKEDLMPKAGSLCLIDNDLDGSYDVVKVTSYMYVIAESGDEDTQAVFGLYPKIVIGDNTDRDVELTLKRNGMPARLSALSSGTALAVKQSKNLEGTLRVEAEMIADSRVGTIEMLSDDKMQLSGTTYDISKGFVSDEECRLGDLITGYIHNGRWAAAVHSTNDYLDGYLVDAGISGSGLKTDMEILLLDSSKNEKVYEVGEWIYVDGKRYTDMNTVSGLLLASAKQTYDNEQTQWPYSQPVRYRVNDKNKLTYIDTLTYNSDVEPDTSLRLDMPAARLKCSYFNNSFINPESEKLMFSIRSYSDVLIVPNLDRDKNEWYMSALGDNEQYWIEAYNIDEETMLAERIVVYEATPSTVYQSAEPWIVKDVSRTLNSYDVPVIKVMLVGAGGAQRGYELSEKLIDEDLSVGDVIRFSTNRHGVIEYVTKSFSAVNGEMIGNKFQQYGDNNGYKFSSQNAIIFGTALSVKDGMMLHTTSVAEDIGGVTNKENLNNYLLSGASIYIYDTGGRKPCVRTGSISDIVSYSNNPENPSKVLIVGKYGMTRFVYVQK